ncbi:netrin-G1-like [Salvelinus fontinalis]|uniref:netrin-G1-like n=1 Tax=Salvelinus fontinalis TaxID=8038 RepID=UPI002485D89F|nr:netrin-G1-like [Salvelinus fontinalis]
MVPHTYTYAALETHGPTAGLFIRRYNFCLMIKTSPVLRRPEALNFFLPLLFSVLFFPSFDRCKCNLHANSCVFDKEKLNCECEHNTTGPDCGRCKRNYQGRTWSAGSYLPIPKGTANTCIPSNIGPVIRPNVSSLGVANRNQARVCDNELLRCQNGGVCLNNLRCQCTPVYTGLLCEKPRCESELGSCGGPNSGQAALSPTSLPTLLLLLLGWMLLRGASYWPWPTLL